MIDPGFEEDLPAEQPLPHGTLTISIDGWEGPMDLLLALARSQKVDLRRISILELVEQYLAFVENAVRMKLELAADYLVMAAWLAYLKSALLLPADPQADPSPEEMALRLQLRLQRLAAMREAGARLMARDRLGRDIFRRGNPEGLHVLKARAWQCSYFELLRAYAQVQARRRPAVHMVRRRRVMTLEEAIERMALLLGQTIEWTEIAAFLPDGASGDYRRSAIASSFLAALELARTGRIEMEQSHAFAPLRLRMRLAEGAT